MSCSGSKSTKKGRYSKTDNLKRIFKIFFVYFPKIKGHEKIMW
jgi:hypothetical protein